MRKSNSLMEKTVRAYLEEADIAIGGDRPWDITVHDDRFFSCILKDGSLGAGESYMEGWWDCDRLDEMAYRVLRNGFVNKVGRNIGLLVATASAWLFDLQRGRGSRRVAEMHYDLPVDLFEAMLGPTMNYSCAYWREARDLTAAQIAKMQLICRKLQLRAGMRLLDIGCGWGGLAAFAAREYSCDVIGITVSNEQAAYGRTLCSNLPVEILALDYRDCTSANLGEFDAIASVGMLEHVGPKNYPRFFRIAAELLRPDGLLLIQTFGRERSEPIDRWINKYIFPNSYVPSADEICAAKSPYFVLEDWHNFGADYDRTLMAWTSNFEIWAASNWKLTNPRMHRMWRYYLLTFAAGFRIRRGVQLWQMVLSPNGVPGGYASMR